MSLVSTGSISLDNTFKNMKILDFFLFLWVIFTLLDPDPESIPRNFFENEIPLPTLPDLCVPNLGTPRVSLLAIASRRCVTQNNVKKRVLLNEVVLNVSRQNLKIP